MSIVFRRTLPMVLCTSAAMLMCFEYFFRTSQGSVLATNFRTWATVVVSFTYILGFAVTTIRHAHIIQKKTSGEWYYSILLIVSCWGITIFGVTVGVANELYQWLFTNTAPAIYGAMSATTGFFVASAAYRAVKVRTKEAAILLACMVGVMLGNVPIGELIWPGFTVLNQWIMNVLVTAGMRGFVITIAFGFIALVLRIISGIEKRWLGD